MHIRQLSTLKNSLVNFDLGRIKRTLSIRESKLLHESCYKIGTAVGRPVSEIIDMTRNADSERILLLQEMQKQYFLRRNRIPSGDSEYIIDIYNSVTKPTTAHFGILESTGDSFETVSKIFDLATDQKSLEFVQNIQHDVFENKNKSSQVIVDMLSSPNRELYIANPDNFYSYLKLNLENPNAIKKLDKMIDEGKYNQEKYDTQLSVQKFMKNRVLKTVMAGKTSDIEKHYTDDRGRFLKRLINGFVRDKQNPQENTQRTILDIYNSANAKNLELRMALVDKFRHSIRNTDNGELKELDNLFKQIDKSDDVRNFIKKVIEKDLKVNSVSELNNIISVTPLKKATIFFNNTKRIISISAGEERTYALKNELENPFYTPKHIVRRTGIHSGDYDIGFVEKMLKIAENQIDKFRYRRAIKTAQNKQPAEVCKIKFARPKLSNANYKIKLSEEVNKIIKNILSEKAYEKQYEHYTQNVTGIRLKLLPDIFDAVKSETGKTKNCALVLYKKINDRNRGLVRYMLKQTNEYGIKVFNLKDIISIIDDTEAKIAKLRKTNPDFRYADTKTIYKEKYRALAEKYGKLRKNNNI